MKFVKTIVVGATAAIILATPMTAFATPVAIGGTGAGSMSHMTKHKMTPRHTNTPSMAMRRERVLQKHY